MTSFPQIVIGTYEEFVLGYSPQCEDETSTKCKLHQYFATHSHQASVRCIAAHNHLMASSGADEYINIYDMVAMEVSTVINYHDSTVTCLEFTPDGSHLVTANQNGDIAIFRCTDWTLVKLWKEAHKHANGVTSINIHPSGSLLLTTGADNIVRFWNLVKGRQAYATNFSKKCSLGNSLNFGVWSKNGDFYAVGIGNTLEIYKTKTAGLVYEIKANARVTYSTFVKKSLICISMEDGSVEIHSINKKKLMLKKQAHETRTKSLKSFDLKLQKDDKIAIKSYIVTIDSKGEIKLWYLKKKGLHCSLLPRGEADCGCRITCLALVSSKDVKTEQNGTSDQVPEVNIIQETTHDSENKEIHVISVNQQANFSNKNSKRKEKKLKRKITENVSNSSETLKDKRLKCDTNKSNKDQNSTSVKNKSKPSENKMPEVFKKKGGNKKFHKKFKAM